MNQPEPPIPDDEIDLPLLTDVVDEASIPVLLEEEVEDVADFDFSDELQQLAEAVVEDELDIPPDLLLDDLPPVAPAAAEPSAPLGEVFDHLPSLDLESAGDDASTADLLPPLAEAEPPGGGEAPLSDAEEFSFELPSAAPAPAEAVVPEPAAAMQPIDLDSLPRGVLGGGAGVEAAPAPGQFGDVFADIAPITPSALQREQGVASPPEEVAAAEAPMAPSPSWNERPPAAELLAAQGEAQADDRAERAQRWAEARPEGRFLLSGLPVSVHPQHYAALQHEPGWLVPFGLHKPKLATRGWGQRFSPLPVSDSLLLAPQAEIAPRPGAELQPQHEAPPEPEVPEQAEAVTEPWSAEAQAPHDEPPLLEEVLEAEAVAQPWPAEAEAAEPMPQEAPVLEETLEPEAVAEPWQEEPVLPEPEPQAQYEAPQGDAWSPSWSLPQEEAAPEDTSLEGEPGTLAPAEPEHHVFRTLRVRSRQDEAMDEAGSVEVLSISSMGGTPKPVRPPPTPAESTTVVAEDALLDAIYARVLPRMKVELSLWLQDALEAQTRLLLSSAMQQLKEDYDMLFAESLRECVRQALSDVSHKGDGNG